MIARCLAVAMAVAAMGTSVQAQDRFGGILAIGLALTLGPLGDAFEDQPPPEPAPSAEEAPAEVPSDLAAALTTKAMTSATAR